MSTADAAPKKGSDATTPVSQGPVRQCREHPTYAACKACAEGRGYTKADYDKPNQCGGKPR